MVDDGGGGVVLVMTDNADEVVVDVGMVGEVVVGAGVVVVN